MELPRGGSTPAASEVRESLTYSREPASAVTHLLGALLSVGGLIALIYRGAVYGTA